jgi:glycosyltransferase involved in cell wall biosynthesis
MGVPTVISNESAIPEVVEHGKTGLLVPPGRPEEMARAMLTLLTETNLRKQIIPEARARVTRDFDSKLLIRQLASVYQERIPEFRRQRAEDRAL